MTWERLLCVLFLGIFIPAAAAQNTEHERSGDVNGFVEEWCTRNGLPGKGRLPLDFLCGGTPAHQFLEECRAEAGNAPGQSDTEVLTLTHDEAGLCIEVHVRHLSKLSAVDWVCFLSNVGVEDSPLIEQFMPVAAQVLGCSSRDPVTLRWSNGDSNARESFLPHDEPLALGTSRQFGPVGGRSSNGTLPFFNLATSNVGCIVAIGWTGQWTAVFAREDDGTVRVRAGMELTRFRLHPGEKVRSPRVVLLRWQGDSLQDGHNRFRELMLTHYVPRGDGRPVPPPIAFNSAAAVYVTGTPTNIANQKVMARKAARAGCEAFWLDAYWYPQPWHEQVGNWFPRPDDFPTGLRPLSETVHELDMDFVLWFEPERVMPATRWGTEYASLQLKLENNPNSLMNLALPEARRVIVEFLNARLDDWNVDIYRQDFNMDPLPYWRANDSEDRQGVTEMKYVEGLYALWDELRERNPGIQIDNCSSGGRRIDIETCRRAWPLWRSDFNDIGEGLKGPDYFPRMGCADQVHAAGLSLYVPFHTGPVWASTPYTWRSAMNAGIVLYGRIDDFDPEVTRQAIEELRRLRPLFEGDLYLLTPLSTAQDAWHAYQLHRADLGRGCALIFRRPECSTARFEPELSAIIADRTYRVTLIGEAFEHPTISTLAGFDLRNHPISIAEQPGSALLEYELLPSPK